MKKSIKFNIILNAFRMALTVLVPLITFPYTSRIFLTEGTGQLNFASSVATIFSLIASLGIYTYGVREGVKVRENKEKFSKLAHELLMINGLATIAAYVMFFVCVKSIPSFMEHKVMLYIYSAQILFTAMGCDWVFGVYEEYTYITLRQIAVQIVTIVAMFLFVHQPEDIYIWAGISVVSSVGANIFNMMRALRYISFRKKYKYCLSVHIMPILVLFATQLASKVYNNLDTILLGMMATDHDMGVYSAAVKVNTILITVFMAMTPVFVPKIMELIRGDNEDAYSAFIKKIFSLLFGLAIPACVGLEMMRKPVIVLLAGDAFAESADTMAILTPVILVTSLSSVLYYNILVPIGKENKVLLSTVIAALVNLFVSVLLIPVLKVNGAAVGSLIAECVGLGIAVYYCIKYKRINRNCLPNLTPYIIGSFGIVICCWMSNRMMEAHLLLNLTAAIGASVVIYAVILGLFHDPLFQEGIIFLDKTTSKFRRNAK